jgi:hypothetical protein
MTATTCPRINCGKPLSPGLRYGPTPEPVPTMNCWTCGYENPPLGACCEQRREQLPQQPCSECGVPVQIRWNHRQYTSGNAYCSTTCYANAKRQQLIARTCPCGAAFSRPEYLIRRGRGRYCSVACQRALRPRRTA